MAVYTENYIKIPDIQNAKLLIIEATGTLGFKGLKLCRTHLTIQTYPFVQKMNRRVGARHCKRRTLQTFAFFLNFQQSSPSSVTDKQYTDMRPNEDVKHIPKHFIK
jgi:hypothetical protein